MNDLYGNSIRAMQAATKNVDRSFNDVTKGYRVTAEDGTVLLAFTGSASRAKRMELSHPGSTISEVERP